MSDALSVRQDREGTCFWPRYGESITLGVEGWKG